MDGNDGSLSEVGFVVGAWRARVAVGVVVLVASVGCSGGGNGARPASESPAARPASTAPKLMALGTVGNLTDANGNPIATMQITDLKPKVHVPTIATRRGKRQIATVMAKACNGAMSQPGGLDWGPFALALDDGTMAEALDSWSDTWFSEPLFPQNRNVQPGDCVRGLVPFGIQKGTRPVRIEYQVPGGDTLLWSVTG